MELSPLPVDEEAVRRFSEELWLPYHRALEATVESHALVDAPDEELVEAEVEFRLGRLADEHYRLWVAVDDAPENPDIASGDGELAGFVATSVDETPSVFDRPTRLVVGDIYVREAYRGTGVARELMARAAERAREVGCAEITLDVDVDNERALVFYEKFGFEPLRHQLVAETDEV